MKRYAIALSAVILAMPASLPSHDAQGKAGQPLFADMKMAMYKADRGTMLERLIQGVPANPARLDRQTQCLAQAIYFEARGEPLEGQLAVGQVVMNRVESDAYPDTTCEVVFQNEGLRHRCQFSFACDGKSDRPRDWQAWNTASRVAIIARSASWRDLTRQATHYHASYVSPYWSAKMHQTAEFGLHRFFRAGASK